MRELKTTSNDASSFERRVDLDPQVRLYAHAAELAGLTEGEPIQHVQYVVLRKKLPSLPKLIKCPGCNGGKKLSVEFDCDLCGNTGESPSTDKRLDSVQEVLLEYLIQKGLATQTIVRDSTWQFCRVGSDTCYVHPRFYDLLANMSYWSKFISISSHWLDPHDKAEALSEAWAVAKEIADATLRYSRKKESYITAFPRNTSQCTGPAGFCEYKEICVARMCMEDFTPGNDWETNMPDSPEIERLEKERDH